jgi:cytochrome c oxidase subunit I+III
MAAIADTPEARARIGRLERIWQEPDGVLGWLKTTDHKRIGILYLFATLVFFGAGGVEALLVRTQLIGPDLHVLSPKAYDQVFTMHGVTMVFLFVIPMTTGAFGNYLIPLMIGARDMAFPRMNALSFWIFAASGIFMYMGMAVGQAPDAGWFNYVPLASRTFSPDRGIDFYALGLIFNSISTTAAAANFIVTIFRMRAPGMSVNRMPLFAYAFLATAFALIFALPALTVALLMLEADRRLGFHFYDVLNGGDPVLWQHLFWIFGHPEVYIIILPAFGIATSIIPAFTRRRMVAFPLVALAELLVAFIGFGVWAHHMFATGLSTTTAVYFAAASLVIVIPSGIQLFAWITTIVTGTPAFRTPLLFIVGFIVFFLLGGLSGVMVAAIPFDQQVTDTYFIVAHFHFVIFGAAVFPILGGLYYWFPKVTGRMYHEGMGVISFWLTFVGTTLTFFPMHILGLFGMPRRQYTYPSGMGWTTLNLLESIGSFVLAAGLVLIVANLARSLWRGEPSGPDPWAAPTLEWTTSSPPPEYNFAVIPAVTSPYPNWDSEDRAEDRRALGAGVRVFEQGEQTPSSSVLDGDWDEVLDMPSESGRPIVFALALGGLFTMLLLEHWVTAGVFAAIAALVLAWWHADEPPEPSPVARDRPSLPVGVWGMVMLIFTEGALFFTLLGSYWYLRFRDLQWPPPGIEDPKVVLPLVLTGVLVAAVAPVFMASAAAREGRLRAARSWLVGALVVHAAYLAAQVLLFRHDLGSFSPNQNAYGSVYFGMLGLHHAHVAVGMLLEIAILAKLTRGLTSYRVAGLRAIAWYWGFVAIVAVPVVLTQLSPSL